MKKLLELISKNKLLIVILLIALAVGAVLQFAVCRRAYSLDFYFQRRVK